MHALVGTVAALPALTLVVAAFAALVALAAAAIPAGDKVSNNSMETVFRVQYPRTLEEGLAGRDRVEAPMLFRFPGPPKVRSMWMKGMRIPIDIVWIDETGTVTTVYTHVPPVEGPFYSSKTPAAYAIETAAGDSARLGLVPGTVLTIRSK